MINRAFQTASWKASSQVIELFYQQIPRVVIRTKRRTMTTAMKPSKTKYQFVEDVERLDFYVPNGYHVIGIGDKFKDGRYTIIHKLGFGRSATTWLAEDKQENKLVALKISTAESAYRTQEEQILSKLAKAKSQLSGKNHIQTLYDSFEINGANGTHRCLVLAAERASIAETKEAAFDGVLRLSVARAIATQLIFAVQFIHSQGIVHGGMFDSYILISEEKTTNI